MVSPLISLMEDQLKCLNDLGISTAIFNSNTTREQAAAILKGLEKTGGPREIGFRLLYVTPEKLAKSKRIMVQLEKCYKNKLLKRLVIDEVHCCSSWGHDFRPDYQFLGIMRRQFPSTPIMGLTATATPDVIADIQKILNIEGCFVFKDSFYRPNLSYRIKRIDELKTKEDQVNDIAQMLKNRYQGRQCGLIYCLTVKEVDELANKLSQLGIRAAAYHAQLSIEQRNRAYQAWFNNRLQVIVATIAFGMGINKLDVRFVIHASMSKSLENYYQETGRAGRDGRPAECILYFKFADIFRATTLVFSEKNGLANVYSMVAYSVNRETCLKEQMSNYFGDVWRHSCNEHCDNCRQKLQHDPVDLGDDMRMLAKILKHAASIEKRLTAPKLLEIWLGKGEKKLRPEGLVPTSHGREQAQNIIIALLMKKFLREEFHFTPYSTISYIAVGSMFPSRSPEQLKIACSLPKLAGSVTPKKTKTTAKKTNEPEVHDFESNHSFDSYSDEFQPYNVDAYDCLPFTSATTTAASTANNKVKVSPDSDNEDATFKPSTSKKMKFVNDSSSDSELKDNIDKKPNNLNQSSSSSSSSNGDTKIEVITIGSPKQFPSMKPSNNVKHNAPKPDVFDVITLD